METINNKTIVGHWSEPCLVYWHDADMQGTISFSAIARYLQEAAWHSAESLGFGYSQARALNQFWVLVRQHIHIPRFPRWSEKLLVETWPRGTDGFWAFRDYLLRDATNTVVGRVTSSWMIIDAGNHRPQKPGNLFDTVPFEGNPRALPHDAPKITFTGPWSVLDERLVRYSDMDQHGHVNNSKFIEWIFDALRLQKDQPEYTNLRINYLAEARENQAISIAWGNDQTGVVVKGERKTDKKLVFMATVA